MKIFVLSFLYLALGFAVQSVCSEDGEFRTSLRTFLLYFLLRDQSASSAAATTSTPYSQNVSLNFLNNTNTTGATITVNPRGLINLELGDELGDTQYQPILVPNGYYELFRQNIAQFRSRLAIETSKSAAAAAADN